MTCPKCRGSWFTRSLHRGRVHASCGTCGYERAPVHSDPDLARAMRDQATAAEERRMPLLSSLDERNLAALKGGIA